MKNDFGIHVHKTSGQQKLFPPWHISTEQSQYWALCKTTVSQCHAKCNYNSFTWSLPAWVWCIWYKNGYSFISNTTI